MYFYQLVGQQGEIISAVRSKNPLENDEIFKFCCEIEGVDCGLARTIFSIIELLPKDAKWFSGWSDWYDERECHRCLKNL